MSEQITAQMVNQLRSRTGAGIMDCKRALLNTNGKFEEAIDLLKKEGVAMAAKKAGREAREGVIESYIHLGGKVGVLLELNCETDFVAKNDEFKQLAKEEMHHMEILEEFKADPTKMMNINAPKTDTKVAEATELPSLSADMKPADAIALAMKKEQEAVEFYRNLGKQCTSSESCRFFENLAKMELTHKQKLENLFVEIGYPEVF